MRPPRPRPRKVTVVSPPETRTQGGAAGWPWRAHWRAIPAITRPTTAASPSMASPRINGVTPASRASAAAASRAACGVATSRVSARAKAGSPGLGVSAAGSASRAATAAGGRMA